MSSFYLQRLAPQPPLSKPSAITFFWTSGPSAPPRLTDLLGLPANLFRRASLSPQSVSSEHSTSASAVFHSSIVKVHCRSFAPSARKTDKDQPRSTLHSGSVNLHPDRATSYDLALQDATLRTPYRGSEISVENFCERFVDRLSVRRGLNYAIGLGPCQEG